MVDSEKLGRHTLHTAFTVDESTVYADPRAWFKGRF